MMIKAEGIAPALPDKQSPRNQGLPAGVGFDAFLLGERFPNLFAGSEPERCRLNLFGCAASPRFRPLKICAYQSVFQAQEEVQFAAMAFVYKDEFAYLCFRGTDQSWIGWKEDFNMTSLFPVPAQELALTFTEILAPSLPERLYLGGHSKGGNLAEYVALKLDKTTQNRVQKVFNLDGPGFKHGAFSNADYTPIIDRIHKIGPQDDIVGSLLNSPVPIRPIYSDASGFGEHNIFQWQVDLPETALRSASNPSESQTETPGIELKKAGSGINFVSVGSFGVQTKLITDALRRWVNKNPDAINKRNAEAFFRFIEKPGVATEDQIFSVDLDRMPDFMDQAVKQDTSDAQVLLDAAQSFGKSFIELLNERIEALGTSKSEVAQT